MLAWFLCLLCLLACFACCACFLCFLFLLALLACCACCACCAYLLFCACSLTCSLVRLLACLIVTCLLVVLAELAVFACLLACWLACFLACLRIFGPFCFTSVALELHFGTLWITCNCSWIPVWRLWALPGSIWCHLGQPRIARDARMSCMGFILQSFFLFLLGARLPDWT